jgi:hypothetical protein
VKFWRRVGGWLQRWHYQGGVLRVDTMQEPAERAAVVAHSAEIRAQPSTIQDLTFGRCVLTIPLEDYYRLLRERPALAARDRLERERAWRALLASSDVDEFRLQPRVLRRYH